MSQLIVSYGEEELVSAWMSIGFASLAVRRRRYPKSVSPNLQLRHDRRIQLNPRVELSMPPTLSRIAGHAYRSNARARLATAARLRQPASFSLQRVHAGECLGVNHL